MFAAGFTSISDELMIRPQPNPHVLALLSSFGPLAFRSSFRLPPFQLRDVGSPRVLGAMTSRNHALAEPARKCGALEEPEKPREPCRSRVAEATPGDSFLDQCLHALREPRGER